MEAEGIKKAVRKVYGKRVKESRTCCDAQCSCAEALSKKIGYTQEEMESVPEGSNLGLGCGNPVAIASIKPGETVLDLGSGAGFDCFLASQKVGNGGKVIGVDMTKAMIKQATANAKKGEFKNVEFRLGEIENLPVDDGSVDLVISNCVINLSTDKKKVFKEAFRALRPNGRIMISDMVLLKELPSFIRKSVKAYAECLGGAILKDQYLGAIREAGFKEIKVVNETRYPAEYIDLEDPDVRAIIGEMNLTKEQAKKMAEEFIDVVSISVNATKPL